MLNTVTNLDSVKKSIEELNSVLPDSPGLIDRLRQAHAFYVLDTMGGPTFGFSKYVGYEDISPEKYLKNYTKLNGRNTEHALKKWYEEVTFGTPAYQELFKHLELWMQKFGKQPRNGDKQKTRIMILKPEYRSQGEGAVVDDRRLLDLLVAVADLLPADQRNSLRATL